MRCPDSRSAAIVCTTLFALALELRIPDIAHAQCVVAPEGLVAWWPADGDAEDIVGNNHGTLANGATFGDGEVDQSFAFDGDGARVVVPASDSIDVGTGPGFTIELWVNPDSNNARDPLVEWNRASGTPNWGVHLWIATTNLDPDPHAGNVYANLVDTAGTSHVMYSAEGILSGGVFQHVALTYDKATGIATLYANGVSVASSNVGTFTPETSYDLYFANRPGPTSPMSYAGRLDEVSLFDRALSAEEIQGVYDAGSSGKCVPSCGDTNEDGDVKAGDALLILRSAVGIESCVLCVCDVNRSGTITSSDAQNALRNAVGVKISLGCPVCELE